MAAQASQERAVKIEDRRLVNAAVEAVQAGQEYTRPAGGRRGTGDLLPEGRFGGPLVGRAQALAACQPVLASERVTSGHSDAIVGPKAGRGDAVDRDKAGSSLHAGGEGVSRGPKVDVVVTEGQNSVWARAAAKMFGGLRAVRGPQAKVSRRAEPVDCGQKEEQGGTTQHEVPV